VTPRCNNGGDHLIIIDATKAGVPVCVRCGMICTMATWRKSQPVPELGLRGEAGEVQH
jgi:hypothetical protein